jgi:diketogulonate reductase-like aldo/keto reductase
VTVPHVTLANNNTVPQIGLGLWQIKDQMQFQQAFEAAWSVGYRHFDTAQAYGNEQYLGEAWSATGATRDDVFITTKIWIKHFGVKHLKSSFDDSLASLQTDYVDLLLLHFPVTLRRKKAWLALERLHAEGKARTIGVSNYTIRHLEEMKKYASIMPVVNQVELHVFLQQPELVQYCKDHGIMIEAYSPLAHAKDMHNQTVSLLAQKYEKTYAQIMLRWLVQEGHVVLPKSGRPQRIRENYAIFDFEISTEDMELLRTQDRGLRTCWNPTHIP